MGEWRLDDAPLHGQLEGPDVQPAGPAPRARRRTAAALAETINPKSSMWMGFSDAQVGSSGAPPITTFLGNRFSRLTSARPGDYLSRAWIVHLSHLIQDLKQFYTRPGETLTRRVSAMFTSNPPPSTGNADQFTDGGGPAYIPNFFVGPTGAERETARSGPLTASPPRAHQRTAALQPHQRRQADPHPRRRSGLRLARCPRRLAAAEAALRRAGADVRLLRHHAPQPGLTRPRPAVQRAAPERRPGAVHHGDPATETSSFRPAATGRSRCSSWPRPLRLATWNVNSLPARLPRVLKWLERVGPDVLCIQETKVADAAFPFGELAELGYEAAADGGGAYNGVAILSRVGLEEVARGFEGEPGFPDTERRSISASCAGIRVWSVYVPNGRSLDSPTSSTSWPGSRPCAVPPPGTSRPGGPSRCAGTSTSPRRTPTYGIRRHSPAPPTSPSPSERRSGGCSSSA